jgi:hypothetical protein
MKPDPHLIWLAKQITLLDAASPSGQARRAWEADRRAVWEGLAVGDPCRLTQQALDGAQGHDRPPLLLQEATTICRILRIDPDRGLALVMIPVPPTPTEWRGTIAQEVERSEILPAECPAAEAIAAPPAPPPPPPPIRRPPPSMGRGRNRLPSVW